MTFDPHANFALGSVAVAPAPAQSGTTLTLKAGQAALFPAAPFNAIVWPVLVQPTHDVTEIVRVTGVSGDVLTIARQQEGSGSRSILVGDQFADAITAKALTDVEAAIGAETSRAGTAESVLASAVTAEASARGTADGLLVPLTQKGANSGVGSLDSSGRQPIAQSPVSVVRAVSFALGNMGATPSVDLGSVVNQRAMVTGVLNANAALTLANLAAGQVTLLLLTQDGTGGRTLSINGTAVTIPGTAGASCVIQCTYDGTSLYVTLFGGGGGSSGAMTLISDILLVAPAASFDFTAIPGTYKHLKVMFSGRSSQAANNVPTYVRFNGDSTAGHYLAANIGLYGGDGSSAQLNQASPGDKIFIGQGIGTSAGAGRLQVVELTVPDYASAVLGKGLVFTSADFMDAGAGFAGGGVFTQTPAITELQIFPSAGNFIVGSRCSLYGIS